MSIGWEQKTGKSERGHTVFPDCVDVLEQEIGEVEINLTSFETKREYELAQKEMYSLDPNVNLKISTGVDRFGKWQRNETEPPKTIIVSFLMEFRIAKICIRDVTATTIDKELKHDISVLPDKYCASTCEKYYRFFSKWGSHFVNEIMVGGSVEIDCFIEADKFSKQDEVRLKNYFKSKFESFGVQFAAGNLATDGGEQARITEIDPNYDIDMHFNGGKLSPDLHNPISKPNLLTKEIFQSWRESISQNPIELKQAIKLTPFHLFASNDTRKASLLKATSDFLDASMQKNISFKRNDVAGRGVEAAKSSSRGSSCTIL